MSERADVRKALHPGEFVQVGDTEGTVTSVGFLTTRIETLRNVDVTLPNAYLASNVTRNFSRLVANGGMRLTTSVTIGYDTPWRRVQEMLPLAARRTPGMLPSRPPAGVQHRAVRTSTPNTAWSARPAPRCRARVPRC